jgi:hypothetical protein
MQLSSDKVVTDQLGLLFHTCEAWKHGFAIYHVLKISSGDICVAPRSPARLFRQVDLAFDVELSGHNWRSRVWLAATDADGVIAVCDDWIPILGHHAQIAVL